MKHIDLSASVKERFPRFGRIAPSFILRFLEWVIMQDRMNDMLDRFADTKGTEFHNKVIEDLNLKIEIEGLENLPENSKCFFAANHPFGVLDGMLLTKIVGDKYVNYKAIGNDAFMFVPNLRPYIAIVNVYGRSSRENVGELQKLYDSDMAITHFPAGEVSRLYKGKVQDREWQKSFIAKAVSSKRDIVPFCFSGRNSAFFYTVNILRRLLFIKANIELIFLPRELFKKQKKTIKVRIGKPISYKNFDSTHTHYEWAQKVRNYVYSLKNNNNNQLSF